MAKPKLNPNEKRCFGFLRYGERWENCKMKDRCLRYTARETGDKRGIHFSSSVCWFGDQFHSDHYPMFIDAKRGT